MSNVTNKIELTRSLFIHLGACATALLKAGGTDALNALQTVSIAGGLIYTVIICFMCVSMWKILKEEAGESDPNTPQFSSSLLAVLDFKSVTKLLNVAIAAFFPWLRAGQTAGKVYNQKSWPHMLVLAMLMYGWIALEIGEIGEDGLAYIGWVVLFAFFAYIMAIRIAIRARSGIKGSMFEDALTVIFLYPLAVDQMHEHVVLTQNGQRKRYKEADIGLENRGQENGIHIPEKSDTNGGKFEEVRL